MEEEKNYRVTNKGDYIYLETWGDLDANDLDAPANAAITLARENNVEKLLDDIRKINTATIDFSVLTQSVGIMLKLRAFKKVAVVFESQEVGTLFMSSLNTLHLTSRFRGFSDPTEAALWLQET